MVPIQLTIVVPLQLTIVVPLQLTIVVPLQLTIVVPLQLTIVVPLQLTIVVPIQLTIANHSATPTANHSGTHTAHSATHTANHSGTHTANHSATHTANHSGTHTAHSGTPSVKENCGWEGRTPAEKTKFLIMSERNSVENSKMVVPKCLNRAVKVDATRFNGPKEVGKCPPRVMRGGQTVVRSASQRCKAASNAGGLLPLKVSKNSIFDPAMRDEYYNELFRRTGYKPYATARNSGSKCPFAKPSTNLRRIEKGLYGKNTPRTDVVALGQKFREEWSRCNFLTQKNRQRERFHLRQIMASNLG